MAWKRKEAWKKVEGERCETSGKRPERGAFTISVVYAGASDMFRLNHEGGNSERTQV